jgi:hypothetical protein
MLRVCDHSEFGTLTLGRYCVLHEPPAVPERFPRGRPFAKRTLPQVDDASLGDALQPALLAAGAAALSELKPIPAVSLEGGV